MKKNNELNAFEVWLKQANSSNTLSALLKSYSKKKCEGGKLRCSIRVLESVRDAKNAEGPMLRVLLINEGLGNLVNKNYYGKEAIESAPPVFEGKPAFLDHPTESDQRDIPERRVKDKCGYFKNLKTEMVDNIFSMTGELHFDLSESGTQGYLKALSALHYKTEFPGVGEEYVGLSINADGEVEDRRVVWMGETLDVNYVKRFTEAYSCDIVTSPARGGRFLALVESAAGAIKKKREGTMDKIAESLKAAQTALTEAVKESDATKKAEKVVEADRLMNVFLEESAKAAEGKESKKKEDEMDEAEKMAAAKKKEADDKKAAKAKDDEKGDDAVESQRIAVTALAKESGIDLPEEMAEKFARMSLKEAKAEIAMLGKLAESIVRKTVTKMAVPSANYAKMTESERTAAGAENNALFANV